MRAYLLNRSGKPGVLRLKDIQEPVVTEGHVKIKVETIGLNYAEVLSRRGQYSWAPKKPYVPGMEAYGEVVEVGEGVSTYQIGDKVIVGQQFGNYAEFTVAPEHLVFPAMQHFTAEQQAAYLVNFMTAWVALKKLCKVVEGDRVLVQAAAGGVGTAAVQIASAMKCKVYGTASRPEKLSLIESLGAHKAINYANEDFYKVISKDGGNVDAVLEVVGGEVFKKSIALLAPFGTIAVVGFASISLKWWNPLSLWTTYRDAPKVNVMDMAKGSYGIHASHIGYLTENPSVTAKMWKELSEFVYQHDLKPIVGRTFSFDEMNEAHAFMESRGSMGKIVIKIFDK